MACAFMYFQICLFQAGLLWFFSLGTPKTHNIKSHQFLGRFFLPYNYLRVSDVMLRRFLHLPCGLWELSISRQDTSDTIQYINELVKTKDMGTFTPHVIIILLLMHTTKIKWVIFLR